MHLLVTEICTKKILGCAQLWAVSLACDLYRHLVVCKVACSNTSCLEAHAGIFKLLMKGIFDPYVL